MPPDTPGGSDYAYLADSAGYLAGFARGVARELGRENDPEAEGKCETFLESLRSFEQNLRNISEEPYFGLASRDEKVAKFAASLEDNGAEIGKLNREMQSLIGEIPRDKGNLLILFLRISKVLMAAADDLDRHEQIFRGKV